MNNTIVKPSLFNKNVLYQDIIYQWETVQCLMGGTDSMRNAGRLYLRQNPKENNAKYIDRLSRATLTNKYSRSIEKAVGKAFARRMNLKLPIPLESLQMNVDGQGTSFETFSKVILKNAINYGITYILVDYPKSNATTLADQRNSNSMPYFLEIDPTQLLDLTTDYIDNQIQLTYFRFYESIYDYGDAVTEATSVEQIREFKRQDDGTITYNVWRRTNIDPAGTQSFQETIVETGTLSIDYIPIVPIYGMKTAPYMGRPVLMDLAHLNIKHWWKQSDLDWNEHYGLTPMLSISGTDLGSTDPETGASAISEFTVASSTVVNLGESGTMQWTKADAQGIAAAQVSLDRLLAEMDDAGLELTVEQAVGTETATGRILDAAESNSILKGIVTDLNWQLYQCILIAGEYIGSDATDAEVDIDTSYTATAVTNTQDFTLLLQLFEAKVLTLEEIRLEMQSRKIFISEKVDEALSTIPKELENVPAVESAFPAKLPFVTDNPTVAFPQTTPLPVVVK